MAAEVSFCSLAITLRYILIMLYSPTNGKKLVICSYGRLKYLSSESSARICSIFSAESSKSKMSMFSWMWLGFVEPGMTENPSWTCQRRITWTTLLPCASAISISTGFCNSLASAWPSGYQHSIWIPYSAANAHVSFLWANGWHSI